MPGSQHGNEEYVQLSLAAARALAGSEETDFSIYLPGKNGESPVLYRQGGEDFSLPDITRMQESGVARLSVRTTDLLRCEQILESNLKELLNNPQVPPQEKAEVVHQVGTAVARDLVTSHDGSTANLTRTSSVLDSVIESVFNDPAVAVNLLHLAGHDRTVASHMFVVSTLSVMLGAEVYGADLPMLRALGLAGMLHDIGKLTIRPEVLNKATPLTADEIKLVQQHPIESVRLLGDDPHATPLIRQMILQHHERMDGRGYPLGISSYSLLHGSRILSIVDSFHAMIGRRPYRTPLSPRQASQALNAQAGRQFDADLLRCWRDLFERSWCSDDTPPGMTPTGEEELSPRHEHKPIAPPPQTTSQRRKRHICDEDVMIRFVYSGRLHRATEAPDEFVASVRDVSNGGLCVFTPFPLYTGEMLHAKIRKEATHSWVRATVAWCQQHDENIYRSGLTFIHRIAEPAVHTKLNVRGISEFDPSSTPPKRSGVDVSVSAATGGKSVPSRTKRERALAALAAIGTMRRLDREARRTTLVLSTSGDAQIRLETIGVLIRMGTPPARDSLLLMLEDPSAPVREQAAMAVGAMELQAATFRLKQLLQDDVETVALRAAAALGKLGNHAGLQLVRTALEGKDAAKARLAARAFGDIVGHRFGANAEGVKAARRYLSARKTELSA